jgi:hypothetical protein
MSVRSLAIPLALLAFFLNPGLACTDEPQFQYGEAEMKAAAEGTWVITLGNPSNDQITVQVVESSKAQADQIRAARGSREGFISSAFACGNRTFVASAHACIDESTMPLDVVFVSGPDTFKDASMSGGLAVHSLVFSQGDFYLYLGSLSVFASIAPDGTVNTLSGGSNAASLVSLNRTAR